MTRRSWCGRFLRISGVVVALSVPILGASITTKVMCEAGGASVTSNALICGESDNAGDRAGTVINLSTSVAGNSFSVSAQMTSNATGNPGGAISSGSLNISDSLELLGTGAGFMVLQRSAVAHEAGSGFGKVNYSAGNISDSCIANNFTPPCSSQQIIIPIELEDGINFSLLLSSTAAADSSGGGIGLVQFDGMFSFFAADGTTPVQVVDTPEPSTFATMGMGLCLFAVARRKLT